MQTHSKHVQLFLKPAKYRHTIVPVISHRRYFIHYVLCVVLGVVLSAYMGTEKEAKKLIIPLLGAVFTIRYGYCIIDKKIEIVRKIQYCSKNKTGVG